MSELAFVTNIYRKVLLREPDAGGVQYWTNQILLGGINRDTVTAVFMNGGEFQNVVAPIVRLYENLLGRAPDAGGVEYWAGLLRAGKVSLHDITNGFLKSAEASSLGMAPSVDNTAFVKAMYRTMGRTDAQIEADKSGVDYWVNQLNTFKLDRAGVATIITESPENVVSSAGYVTGYAALRFVGIDAPGTAQLNAFSATASSIEILTAAKTVTDNKTLPTGTGTKPVEGGTAGQTFTLTAGQDKVAGTAGNDTINADHTTLQATDEINGGNGKDVFNYTDAGTVGGNVPAALVSGVEVVNIRNVNGTAAVAATKEKVTITFSDYTHGAASSITIDGGVENLTASKTGAELATLFAAKTFTNYDFTSVNGNQLVLTAKNAGNVGDIAVSSSQGAGSTLATPSKAIVQGTDFVASTGVNDTVTASNFAGATEFNSVNSLNKVTFSGLAAGQKVGMVGNGTISNGEIDFSLAAGVDAVTVEVKSGTKTTNNITNTGATVTTATINSDFAANTVGTIDLGSSNNVKSLTVNAYSKLTATLAADYAADAALTVTGNAEDVVLNGGATANFKTIDASALSKGGLEIALGTGATSFKGGQGNDVVTTAGIVTTASIDAGAGSADVLVVGAAGDVDTVAEAAVYKGFEVLRTSASQDMSVFTGSTITALQINTATSAVISKITTAQASDITVRGDQGTNLTLTLADATGSSDAVTLKLKNPTETASSKADVDVTGLKVAGVETLNVQSLSGDTSLTGTELNSLSFGTSGADKLTSIKLSGDRSLDLNLGNTEKAVTVDTSGLTGSAALKVAGNVVKGSVINATANKDDITVTAQADGAAGDFITYNAGAGDDAISATAAALNNSVNTKASVKIDAGAGTDTLTFSETNLTLGDAQFQYVTNVEKFVNSAAGTVTIATGGFFDSNYKAVGAEFTLGETTTGAARSLDASSFTGKLTVEVKNNDTANVSTVKTGSADDKITLTQGTTKNTTTHVIEAGQGNDTIVAKDALVKITGGRGADVIDITDAVNESDTIVIAAGDSTAAARDKVTGFQAIATSGDQLDLAGTFSLQGAVTAADGTDSGLVKSHSITSGGIITFDDINAYDTALTINSSNLTDVLNYLTANITTAGKTVGFAYDSDSNGAADATIVFQAGADAANATVVELVGLTGVTTLAGSAGANTIFIG